ncbi:MAG: hypothetical protein ACE5J9_04095 [Methanosarcinales archaeon]
MLTEIFGDYPQVKVIKLLVSHPNIEYTKEDIAECTGISSAILNSFWDKLEKFRIVKQKKGDSNLYLVNSESDVVKTLEKFIWKLIDIEIEEQRLQIHPPQKVVGLKV